VATFPWSSFPTISTPRLRLRETGPDDAYDLFRFRSDQEVQRYNIRPLRSMAEAQRLVATMQSWYRSAHAIQWGITMTNDTGDTNDASDADRVVGICGLHEWLPQHRRAMLGYDLAREHWGRGIAYEAVCEVVRFGFDHLDLDRIEAVTIVENVRSVRLLERLGFTRLDVRRDPPSGAARSDGQSFIYGLSRKDYARATIS
jgi:ribosomal-protein-alanine N-acetyltransferase